MPKHYFITRRGKEVLLMLYFADNIRINSDLTDDNLTVTIEIKSLDKKYSHTEKFDPEDTFSIPIADNKAFHACFDKIAKEHMQEILMEVER